MKTKFFAETAFIKTDFAETIGNRIKHNMENSKRLIYIKYLKLF
jgi:hypothetical protein